MASASNYDNSLHFFLENICGFKQKTPIFTISLYWKLAYFSSFKMWYILLVPFELV